MKAKPVQSVALIFLFVFLLSACGTPQAAPTDAPQQPASAPTIPPTPVQPTDTLAPTETPAPKFPADPQRIEFEAEDGTKLVGYYYPAAVDPAPIVVLMHWAGGSHCEWLGVNLVQWLQNRGLPEGVAGNPSCADAEIPFTLPLAEYPSLLAGTSYAVFAFDYRGHGESSAGADWDPSGWLKDSIVAVQKARTLEGVDPARVASIGASIGADGAIDGCGEGCMGALSLSPGNYLGIKYADAVNALGAEQKPAWCIASKQDRESFPTCEAVSGDFYKKILYEQNAHGMSFFAPGFDPKTTQNIFDFLQAVFGG